MEHHHQHGPGCDHDHGDQSHPPPRGGAKAKKTSKHGEVIKHDERLKIHKQGDEKDYHQVGQHDDVQYRIIEGISLAKKEQIDDVLTKDIKTISLEGIADTVWLKVCLQNMKEGEVSLYRVRISKQKPGGTKGELLKEFDYHQIQCVGFNQVEYLDGNKEFAKKTLKRGSDHERVQHYHEVAFHFRILQGNDVIAEVKQDTPISVPKTTNWSHLPTTGELTGAHVMNSETFQKLLKECDMDESASLRISFEQFKKLENISLIKSLPFKNETDPVVFEFISKKHVYADDILSDGTCIKKVRVPAKEYGRPGKNSQVAISYSIIAGEDKVLYTTGEFPDIPESEAEEVAKLADSKWKNQIKVFFMDEYIVSKTFNLCLVSMKKGEQSELYLGTRRKIRYGHDAEVIKDVPADTPIRYLIKLHGYVPNKFGSSMSLQEKFFHGARKRDVGVRLIKTDNYKQACKTFNDLAGIFDSGKDDEKKDPEYKKMRLSSLLNKSLCELKLHRWEEFDKTIAKILEIDALNAKALYRKAQAYGLKEEYDSARNFIAETIPKLKDADAIKELTDLSARLTQEEKATIQKEKAVFSKMFK